MPELQPIFNQLKPLISHYCPPLQPKNDTDRYYDAWSIKDLVIDDRKRKEVFFAGLIIQKSYVGFYFMPVYTDPESTRFFEPELLRLLKGKSCFHIKKLTPELFTQVAESLERGFKLYQERGWI